MATKDDGELKLRRLAGGRWQSPDERFTIEQQSGRWVVVDAEQTDELGLPRVRGPYASLRAARAAIGELGDAPADVSPLAERLAATPTAGRKPKAGDGPDAAQRRKPAREPEPPPEPAWLARLGEAKRAEARKLIRDLEAADLPDPIGLARRDVADDEPAAARALLLRRLATIVIASRRDPDRLAGEVVAMLTTKTRDPDASLRLPGWRVVEDADGDRRIEISRRELAAEIERLERAADGGKRSRG
jgi:hypothetical protein